MGEFLTEGRRPQVFQSQRPGGVNIATLIGTTTLTDKSSNIQILDPGGANRNVDLPAARDGMWWQFSNTANADEDLVIRDAAGGTIVTINQGEQAMVAVDGTTYGVVFDTQVDLSSIKVDTINESTAGAGVTIDGLRIKDNDIEGVDVADGASNALNIDTGAATSVTGANASGLRTDLTGTTTANGNNGGASGLHDSGSGDSDVTSAHTGGATGTVSKVSGDSDCNDAGGTGGATGAATFGSGDAASTLGTSGATGRVTLKSGNSDDGNSGDVDLTVGTAASGTRGKINVAGEQNFAESGTVVGSDVKEHEGTSATEGFETRIFEATIAPAAVSTAVATLPAGHIVDGVWMQIAATLTAGGTTVTVSLGIAADVDELGTMTSDDFTTAADLLVTDSKWTALSGVTPLSGAGDAIGLFSEVARAVVVSGAATGGATAGDTALSVGSIRIRIKYRVALPMDDA